MIRIDHITDPVRFALSMAIAGALGTPPDSLLALLALAPFLAERILGGAPPRHAPRTTPRTRAARPEPATA